MCLPKACFQWEGHLPRQPGAIRTANVRFVDISYHRERQIVEICVYEFHVCVWMKESEREKYKGVRSKRHGEVKRKKFFETVDKQKSVFETVDKQKSVWLEVGARVAKKVTRGLFTDETARRWCQKGGYHTGEPFRTDRMAPEKKNGQEARIQLVHLFWAVF